MTYRTITKTIVKTVYYSRAVTVQVEETDERLKDERRYSEVFTDEAEQAALEKAETNTLTGWEPCGAAEYSIASGEMVAHGKNVDVTI